MSAGIALVLASLVLASCSTGGATAGARTPSPYPSSLPPTSSPESVPLPVTRLWKLGPIADLAVGPNAVYALYSPSTAEGAMPNATDTRLARIDRATGVVVTAGPFPFAWHIAPAGSAVWIGPNNQYSGTGAADSRTLVSVDARTLATQQRVVLPADFAERQLLASVVADSDSLWVAYGSHVYRLAASTGRTLGSRAITGTASSIALDPGGHRLYVGVNDAQATAVAAITEFEPATLKLLVSAATGGGGLGGPQVAAGVSDVWVSYPTGMMGQVEHRQSSDLSVLPVTPLRFSNGVHVFEVAGIVWVSDSMAGRLVCLDSRTGAVRAGWVTFQGGAIAGDRSVMYLGDITGVSAFQADPRCG